MSERLSTGTVTLLPADGAIRPRIGEVQLRDEGGYIGSTVNGAARLRDLTHRGETVLSPATEDLDVDHRLADMSFVDLGGRCGKCVDCAPVDTSTRPDRCPTAVARFPIGP